MSHDPLCPFGGILSESNDCMAASGWRLCDLIAKVRKDEADRVMNLRYQQVTGWQDMKEALAWQQGQRDMLAKCIAAVEDIKPGDTIDPDAMWMWEESIAALRAIQENP